LQSFQGLLLHLQAVSNVFSTRPEEAKQRLDEAIDQVAQAITEGRDAVQGLRASTRETKDLAEALSALGEELAVDKTNQNRPVFGLEVAGAPQRLLPMLRYEVFRIASEALRNAFRHAQAQRIEVEIRYDEHQLRLRIRDDGRGIDSQILADKGRKGHWGLRGMHERAKLVGGSLEVLSKLDSGTEIQLTIPASAAYLSSRARTRAVVSGRNSAEVT
jgi:signal transduction histidine kinase